MNPFGWGPDPTWPCPDKTWKRYQGCGWTHVETQQEGSHLLDLGLPASRTVRKYTSTSAFLSLSLLLIYFLCHDVLQLYYDIIMCAMDFLDSV